MFFERASARLLFLCVLPAAAALCAQTSFAPREQAGQDGKDSLLDRAIDNVKKSEADSDLYERIERVESRKNAGDANPAEVKYFRVDPMGMGLHRIALGPEGKPQDAAAYRGEVQELARTLEWATQNGRDQKEAREKYAKRKKDRLELIEATRTAFLFTWIADEPRQERMLAKYRMDPNPAYKPTSRSTSILSKIHGFVWVDKASAQLARVEADVTADISIAGFLVKVYKGSHFMQERYEVQPGVWLPSFTQYDFEGRKFIIGFGVHEKAFAAHYRRIGPPEEALPLIRAELDKPAPASGDR
ncbi:MAG TPA: hypothetical protein VEH49_07635 [Methylomirabilota bacterium]|nr:hypothetical protein [Methylomirabilota bacterium]